MADLSDFNRRDFIKVGGASIAGLIVVKALPRSVAAAATGAPIYPIMDIGPLSALASGGAIQFNYPDDESPAILIRLTEPGLNGTGPKQSLVAFSQLCTHKGCPLDYNAERKLLICPCHWSTFDPAKAGAIVIGQASQPLPQIALKIEDDLIRAISVDGLIYGRHTNIF
jgi:arsenite oxidase small subunit